MNKQYFPSESFLQKIKYSAMKKLCFILSVLFCMQSVYAQIKYVDSSMVNKIHVLREIEITERKTDYSTNHVSSSLRITTPLRKLPQNIQIITAQVLADQQVTVMGNDVIHSVSGATHLEHWSMYTRINMRGGRASEFRNGMDVSSSWGPLSVDMGLVDRIEFVKGPAGFMLSNGEPGAIMNVVTKKPSGSRTHEISMMMGSYAFYRASVDLDDRIDQKGKWLYRFNLIGQIENSFRPYEFDHRLSVHPVITYRINDQTDITAEYTLQQVNMSDVGSPYAYSPKKFADVSRNFTTLEPGLVPTRITDQNLFLYFHHQLNMYWRLTIQAAYFNDIQQGSDIWPSSLDSAGNMIRGVSNFDVLSQYAFGQAFFNGDIQTRNIHHRILAGLDLGNKQNWYDWSQYHALDTRDRPFNIYQPIYGSPANGLPDFDRSKSIRERAGNNTVNQNYTAVYLQDELGLWNDRIRLTLAGRYTDVKQSDYGTAYEANHFTPRIGLNISLNQQTSLYLLFDQSFLPQSGLLRGNKTPRPQTGNDLEMGLKKDWMHEKWSTTLSVYRIQKNGLLVNDPDTTDNPDNRYSLQIGQSTAKGIELDMRGHIANGLRMILNYAYTDSRITRDVDKNKIGQSIPGYAHHIANVWLTYQWQNGLWKGFGLSAGCFYQKDRSSWGLQHDGILNMPLPDYFRLDGGLFWEKDHLKINFTANNLLNTNLYSGASYANFYYWQAEPPRNYKLGVYYRF